MSDKRFEVAILTRFCKGCGLCVEFCPEGKLYIEQKPDMRGIQAAAVRADVDCTGCLQCATICPDAAIQIVRVETPVSTPTGGETDPADR